jgi:viroplasmin and RNaseH domain-containing protein
MQATKPKIEDTAESLSNINNLSYLNSESIESQILIKTRWELSDKLFNILKNNKTKKIKSILDFKIIENNDVRENLINFAYYSVRNDYLSLGTVVYYLRK